MFQIDAQSNTWLAIQQMMNERIQDALFQLESPMCQEHTTWMLRGRIIEARNVLDAVNKDVTYEVS